MKSYISHKKMKACLWLSRGYMLIVCQSKGHRKMTSHWYISDPGECKEVGVVSISLDFQYDNSKFRKCKRRLTFILHFYTGKILLLTYFTIMSVYDILKTHIVYVHVIIRYTFNVCLIISTKKSKRYIRLCTSDDRIQSKHTS